MGVWNFRVSTLVSVPLSKGAKRGLHVGAQVLDSMVIS